MGADWEARKLMWKVLGLILVVLILLGLLMRTVEGAQGGQDAGGTIFVSQHTCNGLDVVIRFSVRNLDASLEGTYLLMDVKSPDGQLLNSPTTLANRDSGTGLTTWSTFGTWSCGPFCPKSWRILDVEIQGASPSLWPVLDWPFIPTACQDSNLPMMQAYP